MITKVQISKEQKVTADIAHDPEEIYISIFKSNDHLYDELLTEEEADFFTIQS